MKTRVIAASAIAALLLAGVVAVAYANSSNGPSNPPRPEDPKGKLALTVGQVLSFQNLKGHANNLTKDADGDHDRAALGRSTGNLVLKVTSVSASGATLAITSGNFSIGKTIYKITGGTVTLNAGERSGSGTGTASGGATFSIKIAGIHIDQATGKWTAHFKLDVKVGTSEYHVLLAGPRHHQR